MQKHLFEQIIQNEESLIAGLEQEYTPLDSVLVRSILSDYDFSQPDQLRDARDTLATLQANAIAEEASSFDPSGTSGYAVGSSADEGAQRAGEDGNIDEVFSMSNRTDATSISNGLSSLALESSSGSDINDSIPDQFVHLDTDGKIARLCEMFPTERLNDITYILQKSNGDISKAMEDLMLYVWYNESREGEELVPIRGIEAFGEEHMPRRVKHRKGKNRKFQDLNEHLDSSSSSSSQFVNKWETANADINFITLRTHLSNATVSSTYHKNGASRRKTILALATQNAADYIFQSKNDAFDTDTAGLMQEFPSINYDIAAALLRLTSPSTAYAQEFAKAITTSPNGFHHIQRITPKYAPIKISDDSSLHPSPPTSPLLGSSAALLAARGTAFTQASQYHRKGKSDRLMGGAAAYYASIGRDAHSSLQAATAAEADALVSRQSTSIQLDLHGVSVKDATRIANHRIQEWWNNLGEAKIKGGGRPGVGDGYQIITGLGRHSEGGVGKLGPAVFRMLNRDGWKVEMRSGCITVYGVASGRR